MAQLTLLGQFKNPVFLKSLIRLLDLQNRDSWQQGIDHLRTLFNEEDQDLSVLAADVGFFIKWFCLGSQEDFDEEEYKSEQDKRITTAIQFLKVNFDSINIIKNPVFQVLFDVLDSEVKKQMQAYNALYYTLKEITQLQIGDDYEILSNTEYRI